MYYYYLKVMDFPIPIDFTFPLHSCLRHYHPKIFGASVYIRLVRPQEAH